ncbi:hypothetical protein VTO73DRAFT_2282 [Trametes versicolor]
MLGVSEITTPQYRVLLTVVQLFGGGFLWLSFLRILHDHRTLWERRPATTLLILYILSQYVAIISVLLEIFYVCTYPRAFSVPFGNAALGLRRLSLMSGFGILLLRVNTLWNHALVSTLTSTSLLAFLGVIGLQLSELEIAYIGNKQTPFVSVLVYTSTLIFVLGVLGVLNVRKATASSIGASDTPTTTASTQRRTRTRHAVSENVMEMSTLTAHWLCTVVAATVYFAFQHMDPYYRRAIGFVGSLVGVLTACREYDQLAQDNVEIFFTPLKFILGWWRKVQGESTQPGTTLVQRLSPGRKSRSRSPPQIAIDTSGAGVGQLAEVYELKALSKDGLERRKSPGDAGLETVTEEGSSVMSSPACAFPPAVQIHRRESKEEGRR